MPFVDSFRVTRFLGTSSCLPKDMIVLFEVMVLFASAKTPFFAESREIGIFTFGVELTAVKSSPRPVAEADVGEFPDAALLEELLMAFWRVWS